MHESPRPGEAGYCQVLETAGQPFLFVIQVAQELRRTYLKGFRSVAPRDKNGMPYAC